MCYSLYLSTNSSADLTRYNSELLNFRRLDAAANAALIILRHRQRWYVGSKSECSCTFRHLQSVELGFAEPVAWYPEDADGLRATAELYRVIARLVSEGHLVDCLDIWEGADLQAVSEQVVNLEAVSETAFRLFENYHFVFIRKTRKTRTNRTSGWRESARGPPIPLSRPWFSHFFKEIWLISSIRSTCNC